MVEATAKLVFLSRPRQGKEYILEHDVTVIGRAPSCQIPLRSDFASRHHAEVIRRDDGYFLRDLGSKNGTLLDGAQISDEVRLNDGSEIQIGDAIFRFDDLAAIPPLPTVTPSTAGLANLGPLHLSRAARAVWLEGERLDPPLSPKQFDLLFFLWQRRGRAVSKNEIAAAVWPEVESETIQNYQIDKMVSRLRERLGKTAIETVWGYGFKLILGIDD